MQIRLVDQQVTAVPFLSAPPQEEAPNLPVVQTQEEPATATTSPTGPAIETARLSKSYGDRVAVRGLDLVVERGEIFGFLGHNGAGKTTTINMLTTLLPPSGGSARLFGHDTVRDSFAARAQFGYLPENVFFYDNLSAFENLLYLARLSAVPDPRTRVVEVLDYLDFLGHKDTRVGEFSKGMRQRVGLAQAILHRPRLLFLDEPTSGLDPLGVRQLRALILRLNEVDGMTIFMNTHLLSEVSRTCTSIGVLNHGDLIFHDTFEGTLARFPDEESLEEIYRRVDEVGGADRAH